MRRALILSALGSAAALGYAAAVRLGRWLDAPIAPGSVFTQNSKPESAGAAQSQAPSPARRESS